MNAKVFYRKIGSVMMDNKFDRVVGGQRRGQVDTRSLYKLGIPSPPGEPQRVFKKKMERKGKGYNVVIAIDQSGSMAQAVEGLPKGYKGFHLRRQDSRLSRYYNSNPRELDPKATREYITRIEVAAESVANLVKAIEMHNVNFAIVGVSGEIKVHKDWNQTLRLKSHQLRNEIIQQHNIGWGCSHDWHAMEKAADLFDSAPEGKNILVVFTDGFPHCDGWGDPDDRHPHKSDKNWSEVTRCFRGLERHANTIAVSIGYDASKVYPGSVMANSLDDFYRGFLGKLSRLIKRG